MYHFGFFVCWLLWFIIVSFSPLTIGHLFIYLYLCLSRFIIFSIYLSIHISICLFVYLSIHLYNHILKAACSADQPDSVHVQLPLYIYIYIYIFIFIYVYLSVYLSINLELRALLINLSLDMTHSLLTPALIVWGSRDEKLP